MVTLTHDVTILKPAI